MASSPASSSHVPPSCGPSRRALASASAAPLGDVLPITNRRLSYLEVAVNQKRPAFLHATPSPWAESPVKKAVGRAGNNRADATAPSALTRPAPASSYILQTFSNTFYFT